ncbi:MAG: glycosyltransferase, partial [Xanthomonadales bacterium]|nr:glycosyltransferase [Xanthomonadales bacterium]
SGTGLGFTFTGHSLGAQKLDKLGMNRSNADEMEGRFRFSTRIGAERMSMERAYRIITSTGQERMEQYSHPLYLGAVDVNDDARFAVIPPGVNNRVFSVEPGAEDERLTARLDAAAGSEERQSLVISSRIDEKKNIGKAVEAWAGSPALNQRSDLVLCIRGVDDPWTEIGSMSSEEQDVLTPILETLRQAGLQDRVRFLNLQSQSELAACYRYFARRNSLFVLPSVYEPFGLAPIEAAACGLACVATANGGPSEIFADGSGILVDPFDADDIARGLAEALDRAPELARLGRRRVLDKYTWNKTADRYLDVISDGVAGGGAPGEALGEPDASGRLADYLR